MWCSFNLKADELYDAVTQERIIWNVARQVSWVLCTSLCFAPSFACEIGTLPSIRLHAKAKLRCRTSSHAFNASFALPVKLYGSQSTVPKFHLAHSNGKVPSARGNVPPVLNVFLQPSDHFTKSLLPAEYFFKEPALSAFSPNAQQSVGVLHELQALLCMAIKTLGQLKHISVDTYTWVLLQTWQESSSWSLTSAILTRHMC